MRKTQPGWILLSVIACVGKAAAGAQTSHIASFAADSPGIVKGPQDIRAGKYVQSPEGKVIGTIKSVVVGPGQGAFRYALIVTDSGIVAIPTWAIDHLLRDGHIVIDPELLASAPHIRQNQVSSANTTWKMQANDYWRDWR